MSILYQMNETSLHNKDLIEEVFSINGNDEESDDDNRGFEIEDDVHDDNSERFFGIDPNALDGDDHGFSSEQLLDNDTSEQDDNQRRNITGTESEDVLSREKYYPQPVEGMEFESYDDAYHYYNSYAKELGFGIRVKSSWTKRNSKEKRGAVLCCNCEGFKTFKDVPCRRKETRTGCLAMIRLRLVESNRWRVDEVKLEHNHLFDLKRVRNAKSHKMSEIGVKRPLDSIVNVEVRTIKLYRTRSLTSREIEIGDRFQSGNLTLKCGNSRALHDYFCQKQLTSPNFFYITDLNDEGLIRSVFWIDSRARASYSYFGDVVAIDTTCVSNKYEIPLVAFTGVNHHGRFILLGCALIAEETVETYVWLFRAWLTCMLGRPPLTIMTDRCKAMESAIKDVFPRAHHRYRLPLVMQSILLNLGPLGQSRAFQAILHLTVYGSLKIKEFEISWQNMTQQFGIMDNEWVRILYDNREKWAPIYQKDTFLAGLFSVQADEPLLPFFARHVRKQTSVKEFLNIYDDIMKQIRQQEALDDLESSGSNLLLRTRCYYELQLSKFYTKQIFEKFQVEVEMMPSCIIINHAHTTGPVTTCAVKERENTGITEFTNFEVMFDKEALEVRCICGGFYINGYLCRHALSVLNHNAVEEIPLSYILPRWRKDCKPFYVPGLGFDVIDVSNPCQQYEDLHRRAMQVVEAGLVSQDHYMVACQSFQESLNKVHHITQEKHL
ncbi:hypothetical protein RND81_11G129500 [Saponaria officinalis]|uniref:Protein FAR1-RELATED SEQUENCE n=1 Tax=Saponaria officinalis TaxID=3572 RepID=A0AAW1HMH7_SAPOF